MANIDLYYINIVFFKKKWFFTALNPQRKGKTFLFLEKLLSWKQGLTGWSLLSVISVTQHSTSLNWRLQQLNRHIISLMKNTVMNFSCWVSSIMLKDKNISLLSKVTLSRRDFTVDVTVWAEKAPYIFHLHPCQLHVKCFTYSMGVN